jgi:anti-anti-sigma regulatory factor
MSHEPPPPPRRPPPSSSGSIPEPLSGETLAGVDLMIPIGRIDGCDFVQGCGVTVARLRADFDSLRGPGELERFVAPADRGSALRLIVNLAEAPAASAVLGALVNLQASCRRAGAALAVCGLSAATRESFRVTRLDTVFRVFNSEIEAVAAMSR